MGSISLWQHQQAAIDAVKTRKNFALLFEQGTGKTITAIKIMEQKCGQREIPLPTLILCPQIVIDNWKRELTGFSHFHTDSIIAVKGTGIQRARIIRSFAGANVVLITNYETLLMSNAFESLMEFKAQFVVFDESQKLKSLQTKRTKQAIKLSAQADYRLILSGTPIVNSAFDIFSQFLVMDLGATFGADFHAFKRKFFHDENHWMARHAHFPSWVPRNGAIAEINRLVGLSASRVKKAECLDLPPFIRQRVEVEMGPKQAKAYRSMEKDLVAQIGDGIVSADMALKQVLRLQTITSGFVKMDDGSIEDFETNPKIEALKELVTQIEGKIIIWAVFRRDFAAIRKALSELGIRSVEVHGAVSEAEKSRNVADFESAESGPRILVGHPASAGIGINLVSASYSIFFSRSFNLEYDLQAEARNYRGGSEIHEKVTRIDIIARGTVDETILEALSDKVDVGESIIKKLRGKNGKQSNSTNTEHTVSSTA